MTDADLPAPEPEDVEPLRRWERLWAGLAGAILSGAGVVSVFTTSNQAGSVGLLVAGTVLLVMAVSGTPLTRARFMEYEVGLARQRRRAVVARVQEESPEEARRLLEVLFTLDPEAATDPRARAAYSESYSLLLSAQLHQLFPGSSIGNLTADRGGADMTLRSADRDALVGIVVKPFPMRDARRLREALQRYTGPRVAPVLIVTSELPPVSDAFERSVHDRGVRFVQWRGAEDDEGLRTAVKAAFTEAGAPRG
ncbi:hypothetical protein [Streptomyces sp. KR80]|uniref:hypothetical protein n=1 Tax=Streptomyces sp. KR80 TaxID=3457426 RepID=UPI003FCEE7D2